MLTGRPRQSFLSSRMAFENALLPATSARQAVADIGGAYFVNAVVRVRFAHVRALTIVVRCADDCRARG